MILIPKEFQLAVVGLDPQAGEAETNNNNNEHLSPIKKCLSLLLPYMGWEILNYSHFGNLSLITLCLFY